MRQQAKTTAGAEPSIAHQRLLHQGIRPADPPRFTRAAEVVSWLGAMQAQDYEGAKWSIGLRCQTLAAAEVEAALARGEIVRTWPMRGTLHFVPAADAQWMLALMATRTVAGSAGRHRELELDAQTFARSEQIFAQALAGGERLERSELLALLEKAGISTQGQRGYHILGRQAQLGQICLGPMSGKQQTFVLLEEWVKNPRRLSPEQALAEIARRFFRSHGPATVEDFCRWTGLTLTSARAGLAAVSGELVEQQLDGKRYWSDKQMPGPEAGTAEAYLLPGFDEYLLGYKDRGAVLEPALASRICPGNNGMFMPTLIIAGRVTGIWKRKLTKKRAELTITPFRPLSQSERAAIDAALAPYGSYLGLPVSWTEASGLN